MMIKKFKQFESIDQNISDYFLEYVENGSCKELQGDSATIFAVNASITKSVMDRLDSHSVEYMYLYYESDHILGGLFKSFFVFLSIELREYLDSYKFSIDKGYNNICVEGVDISVKDLMKEIVKKFNIHIGLTTIILKSYFREIFGLSGKHFKIS